MHKNMEAQWKLGLHRDYVGMSESGLKDSGSDNWRNGISNY